MKGHTDRQTDRTVKITRAYLITVQHTCKACFYMTRMKRLIYSSPSFSTLINECHTKHVLIRICVQQRFWKACALRTVITGFVVDLSTGLGVRDHLIRARCRMLWAQLRASNLYECHGAAPRIQSSGDW